MNFFKTLFKPKSSYKINKYPTEKGYKYAVFYLEWDVRWSIDKYGTTGVAESLIMKYGSFFNTYEEAGAAVNRHATKGGGETVWMG